MGTRNWGPALEMYQVDTPYAVGDNREKEKQWSEDHPIIAGDILFDEFLLVRFTSLLQLHQIMNEIATETSSRVSGVEIYSYPEAPGVFPIPRFLVTSFTPGTAFVFLG